MKKFLLSLLILSGFGQVVFAQTSNDIFRYSQRNHSGTARSVGFAGAQSSLGADFGSLSINPAGIALYRSSEFTITPNLNSINTSTDWFGETTEENTGVFSLANIGIVFNSVPVSRKKRENGWNFTNFGIGYNRVYNYNREVVIDGFNNASSITDFFAADAEGQFEDDLNVNSGFGALAWRSFLIDPTNTDGEYVSILNGGQVNQREVRTDSGRKNELLVNYGVNFRDKYFLGVALGIPIMENNHRVVFSEEDEQDIYSNFNSLRLEEEVLTSGTGINISIGTIIRLNDAMRFGFAIKSPTRYSVTESFTSGISAVALGSTDVLETFTESSESGLFDYSFTEPYRINTGISYFFKARGMVSVDYEFVDYGSSKVSFEELNFAEFETILNREISDNFRGTHAIKIAGEFKVTNEFYTRAGVAFTSSPFENENLEGEATRIGVGLGYRTDKYFFDIGFGNQSQSDFSQPYEVAQTEVPAAESEIAERNLMFTFGKRF